MMKVVQTAREYVKNDWNGAHHQERLPRGGLIEEAFFLGGG